MIKIQNVFINENRIDTIKFTEDIITLRFGSARFLIVKQGYSKVNEDIGVDFNEKHFKKAENILEKLC